MTRRARSADKRAAMQVDEHALGIVRRNALLRFENFRRDAGDLLRLEFDVKTLAKTLVMGAFIEGFRQAFADCGRLAGPCSQQTTAALGLDCIGPNLIHIAFDLIVSASIEQRRWRQCEGRDFDCARTNLGGACIGAERAERERRPYPTNRLDHCDLPFLNILLAPMPADRLNQRNRRGLSIDQRLNLRLPRGERCGLRYDHIRIADLAGEILIASDLFGAVRGGRSGFSFSGDDLQHARAGKLILCLLKGQQNSLPVFGHGLSICRLRLLDSRRAGAEIQ